MMTPQSYFRYDYVCLPPDRKIGMHTQPTWELVLNICGAGMRTIGSSTLPICNGEVILVPPGIPHFWDFDHSSTDADGNISHIALLFGSAVLEQLPTVFPELDHTVRSILATTEAIEVNGAEKEELTRLLLSMRGRSPLGRLPVIIEALTVLGRAKATVSVGSLVDLSRREIKLEKLRTYCVCNMARNLGLDEVAAYMGMSKSAFCSFVRRAAGCSFTEYLNGMRLRKAAMLLTSTNERISDIAYQTGFADVPYFNRLFRRHLGVTPTAYRHEKTAGASHDDPAASKP